MSKRQSGIVWWLREARRVRFEGNTLFLLPVQYHGIGYIIKYYTGVSLDDSYEALRGIRVIRLGIPIPITDSNVRWLVEELVRFFRLKRYKVSEIIIVTWGTVYIAVLRDGLLSIVKLSKDEYLVEHEEI